MEDIQNDEAPDEGKLVTPDQIRKRILSEDPIEFVKRFQQTHKLRVQGLEPALALTDVLGLPRGEVYRAVKNKFHYDLMEKLPKVSVEAQLNVLRLSIPYLDNPDLNEIPRSILKTFSTEFPADVYERLCQAPITTFLTLPDHVKRGAWERNLTYFENFVQTIIDQYSADRIIWKTSDNIALALDVAARRSKTRPLTDAKNAVGNSSLLFDHFLVVLRKQFAETGDRVLCTLFSDLLTVIPTESAKNSVKSFNGWINDLKNKHSSDKIFQRVADAQKEKEKENIVRLTEIVDKAASILTNVREGKNENDVAKPKVILTVPPPPSRPVNKFSAKSPRAPGVARGGGGGSHKKKGRPGVPSGNLTVSQAARLIIERTLHAKTAKDFDQPVAEKWPNIAAAYLLFTVHPMDLGTMLKKAKADEYTSLDQVERDLELIANNCIAYNASNPDSQVFIKAAKAMLKTGLDHMAVVRKQLATITDATQPGAAVAGGTEDDDAKSGKGSGDEEEFEQHDEEEKTRQQQASKMDVVSKEPQQPPLPQQQPPTIKLTLPPQPPLPPLPVSPVPMKATDVAMILADPNTSHSLAKMIWDILYFVDLEGTVPRKIKAMPELLWLLSVAEEAQSIVKCALERKSNATLFNGPVDGHKHFHQVLHRAMPLLGIALMDRDKEDFIIAGDILKFAEDSFITRECFLRFVCAQVRWGSEALAIDSVQASLKFVSHPGFRRGLAHVLKDKKEFVNARKVVIEQVLLSRIKELAAAGSTQGDTKELADAHEFLGMVISSKATLELSDNGAFGTDASHVLVDYVTQALKDIDPALYLSSTFKGARQHYEQFFDHEGFQPLRQTLNIPTVPKSGSNRDTSPGSTRPSPSPGSYGPMSASPGASFRTASVGPQPASPSYGSPM